MRSNNYTLILFEKDTEGTPKIVGQKAIPKEQYQELTNPIFKSFMVGDLLWHIKERRYFYREDAVYVNFYVVIDGVRDELPNQNNPK